MTVEAVKKRVRELGGGSQRSSANSTSAGKSKATPLSTLGKAQSKALKTTAKLEADLKPIKKAAATLAKKPPKTEEVQGLVDEKVEELKQTLVGARNDIDDSLKALELGGDTGRDLFRRLRDIISRQVKELKAIFPDISAELTRMTDVDQVSQQEYDAAVAMFKQGAAQAAKLKAACQTIVEQCSGMEE